MDWKQVAKIPAGAVIRDDEGRIHTVIATWSRNGDSFVVVPTANRTWISHDSATRIGFKLIHGKAVDDRYPSSTLHHRRVEKIVGPCDVKECLYYFESATSHCRKTNKLDYCYILDRKEAHGKSQS